MKMNLEFDVIIVGSGLAGIYTALSLDEHLKIAIVSTGSIDQTNSYLAQGGIAAAVGEHDTAASHFADTMACGHHVNNESAVKQLTFCAREEIERLIALGVKFDLNADGSFQFGMEGAHSLPRILRIGDFTGKAIMETLWQRILERKNISIFDDALVYNIKDIQADIKGLDVLSCGKVIEMHTKSVVIATGGMGRLYNRTSNNQSITGDGIALAIKAGISVMHLDWIQFHPTVFYNTVGLQEGFLVSEAVRGDGGILLNQNAERFMTKYHEKLELAPRDIVSRAIYTELQNQSNPYVWLDVRHIGNVKMSLRFPTIYAYCRAHGLDLDSEYVPVAPGAHYSMGGIEVDLDGKTSRDGIYAVGECAYTGVHGSNRLASNSLLEAIVFARKTALSINRDAKYDVSHRVVERIQPGVERIQPGGVEHIDINLIQPDFDLTEIDLIDVDTKDVDLTEPHFNVDLKELTQWMDANMGIEKNYTEIKKMKLKLEGLLKSPENFVAINRIDIKTQNLLVVMNEMLSHVLQEKEHA